MFSILCFIISRKVKTQLKCIKRFVQCKKILWLIECVKSGLQSFSVLLTFWPNNSLLWGCLMHWKMFSSIPGLYPLEANSGDSQHIQNIQINIKLLVKMKNMPFILWKKLNRLFGQPNTTSAIIADFSCKFLEGRTMGFALVLSPWCPLRLEVGHLAEGPVAIASKCFGSKSNTFGVFTQLHRNRRIFSKPWHLSLQLLSLNSGAT